MNRTYITIDNNGKGREFIKIRSIGSERYVTEIQDALKEVGVDVNIFKSTSYIIQIKKFEDVDKLIDIAGPGHKKYKFIKDWKENKELFKP